MERVWAKLKYLLLRRRFHPSVRELREDVMQILATYVHSGTVPSVEDILEGFQYALMDVA